MASIIIVPAARRDGINDILEAIGQGRPLGRMLCPASIQNPTPQTPATHFACMDMGSSPALEAVYSAMANEGTLPELPNGMEWGESGLPEQAAAAANIGPGNMRWFGGGGWTSEEEETEREAWKENCFTNSFGGLQFVPFEEI